MWASNISDFERGSAYIQLKEPPNLLDSGDTPDLPARPKPSANPTTPLPASLSPSAAEIDEQARLLKEYEDKQAALQAQRDAEERRRLELEQQQQREFEQRQQQQAEAQRLAQEQLMQQQMMYNNQAVQQQQGELERELLAMRGQYERDQIFLEQYDRVRKLHILSINVLNTFYSVLKLSRLNWVVSMLISTHN